MRAPANAFDLRLRRARRRVPRLFVVHVHRHRENADAAGLHHAEALGHALRIFLHVLKHVIADDDVELVVLIGAAP